MSAALYYLCKLNAAGASGTKVKPYSSLHTYDMKQLARVLSNVPFPSEREADEKYAATVAKLIKDLPSHLAASVLTRVVPTEDKDTSKVKPKCLCKLHKGLSSPLAYSMWDWVQHELDNAIGPFLYPILLAGVLTKPQEWAARQLEPVLRMYRADFTDKGATPPGFQIVASYKWAFQQNGCPACMLARIGSDAAALSALVSGLVGRCSKRFIGRIDKLRSKRVLMLKYWLRLHHNGSARFTEAFRLGEELQRHHRNIKRRRLAQEVPIMLSVPPADRPAAAAARRPRVAPDPLPSTFSPFENPLARHDSGVDISDYFRPPSPTRRKALPTSSIYSQPEGILLPHRYSPPLRTVPHAAAGTKETRAPSVCSESADFSSSSSASDSTSASSLASSASSFSRLPSYTDTIPACSPKQRDEEREPHFLPHPGRISMYAAYGKHPVDNSDLYDISDEEEWDSAQVTAGAEYGYDVSPPESPVKGRWMESPTRVRETGMTHWSRFY